MNKQVVEMDIVAKTVVEVIHAAFDDKDQPRTVAFVLVDATLEDQVNLEIAYELTNNIDRPWVQNKRVLYMGHGEGCRSTSMGDYAVINGRKYECVTFGWDSVES
jgi:hypothetical protein